MKLLKAKNFKIKDAEGKIFDLYRYQGRSRLLLIFFRGEWCQYCRRQLSELNQHFPWFKKRKIKIVALSADNFLYTSILKEILQPKFIILADYKWKVFSLYGFTKPANQKKIKPALFLINAKRQICYHYIGKNNRDRLTLKQLKVVIKKQN